MSQVLVINPPNSDQIHETGGTVTRPEELTDWANLPSLGVLTLASAAAEIPGVRPVYIDGTVVPWPEILRYIEDNAADLLAVCVSALTASYGAALDLLGHVKQVRPAIRTIIGNDHFTALPAQCLANRRDRIDVGFVGNEVVGPFQRLIAELAGGGTGGRHPGMATWGPDGLRAEPQRPEPVYARQDHRLIDAVFPHSPHYTANFRARLGPRLEELLDVELAAGTPLELARGCIKFSRDDACSFCSIQYGGMWKNAVPGAGDAWRLIEGAVADGYDYLSVTADELPLTFGALLREMRARAPAWWTALPERDRPVLGGYARADGLSAARHAALLRELGIRYLMIGLDAGSPVSLAALNKPLAPIRDDDPRYRAERMFQHNLDALQTARDEGLYVKAGFVIGHLGMTRELLEENVASVQALVDGGKGAIASSDIEVLSPEPGSYDHRYLTDPEFAAHAARRLGLVIADDDVREEIAARHRGADLVDREQAMSDYATALMPGLTLADLAEARSRLREHCRALGIVVGE